MTYEQALEYIHSRPRVKKTIDNKAMHILLEMLDNPQDKLKFVHIAGTNGKGSCAKMLAGVLKQAGYKVGLNISPFVIEFRERFAINDNFIPKDKLAQIAHNIKICQEKIEKQYGYILSEFEIVTAIAFCFFEQEKCDIVCLETGIGGKDDTTNVIKTALVCCIMNISYDHTDILGDSIEKIASHKAGIIKQDVNVVCYPMMDKRALDVIKTVAKGKNAQIILPKLNDIKIVNDNKFKTRLIYNVYNIEQSFTGEHQSYNIAVVIETAKQLRNHGYKISDQDIKLGIETCEFPARIEIISQNPLIILDGAHNLDGISALAQVLEQNKIKNLTAIWASFSDKQPQKIIEKMSPYISKLYTVDLFGARAVDKKILKQMGKMYIENSQAADNLEQAIEKAIKENTDGVVIFGSLFLASDARKYLVK